jgi:hypothetical protein
MPSIKEVCIVVERTESPIVVCMITERTIMMPIFALHQVETNL